MICDKCGFEHNNRSACPKCGARVVYVNEDYLRRKKEWEEAQKSGKAEGALPPGIMHSTREDYDRRHGRDTVTLDNERERHGEKKGGSETAGLSLAVVQEYILKGVSAVVTFFRKKFKKRRGNDNPVIRELKFDDEPETLDSSKLVVSHKIFKDKRPKFLIAAGIVIVAAAAAIIAVNVVKGIDRSRVFYFDGKYGCYAGDEQEPLFGNIRGEITFTETSPGTFLAYDSEALYICRDGKNITVAAANPVPVAYNDSLSLIVYTSGGETMVTDGQNSSKLDIDMEQGYTNACAVSDDGSYFVLTTCSASNDFSSGIYTTYVGEYGADLCQILSDYNDKKIIKAGNDGTVLYLDMPTADYGIINDRTIARYDGSKTVPVAEGIYEYSLSGVYLYYVTSDNELYSIRTDNIGEKTYIDEEVAELTDDSGADEEFIIYRKDDGYYAVTNGNRTGNPFNLGENKDVIYHSSENCFIMLDDSGKLRRLGDDGSDKVLEDDVDRVVQVENYDGFMYLKDNELYVMSDTEKKSEKAGSVPDGLQKAVYSHKYFYCINDKNILYKIGEKGKTVENLGYAAYLAVTER